MVLWIIQGTINATISAQGSIYVAGGVRAGDVSGTGSLKNSGTISLNVAGSTGDITYATALGGYSTLSDSASIQNSGTISVDVSSNSGVKQVFGILSSNLTGDAYVENSNAITMNVSGSTMGTGDNDAIHIYNMSNNSSIINSGTISLTANITGDGTNAVDGIGVNTLTDTASIVNSGTINVHLTSPGSSIYANGIGVNSLGADASITNTGTITVSRSGGYTSYVNAIDVAAGGGSITNSGTINGDVIFDTGRFNLAGGSMTGNAYSNATSSVHVTGNVDVANYNTVTFSGLSEFRIDSGGTFNFANGDTWDMTNNVAGLTLNNDGNLSVPTGATGTITGDYTQGATGLYTLGAYSATNYGQLVVTGTADISASDSLAVDVSAVDALANGDVLNDVLSAGTLITGGAVSVSDNSALWSFSAVEDGSTIDLTASYAGVSSMLSSSDTSTLGVASVIDDINSTGTATGDMQTVINELNSLSTTSEVTDAVSQLSSNVVGTESQTTQTTIETVSGIIDTSSGISDTGTTSDTGLSSGDPIIDNGTVWFKPFFTKTDQASQSEGAGYTADSFGLAVGGDTQLTDDWRIGLAYAYSFSDVDSKSTSAIQGQEIQGHQLIGYGQVPLSTRLSLGLQGGVGLNKNESRRNINFGSVKRTAVAKYNSYFGLLKGKVSHRYNLNDGLILKSSLDGSYFHMYSSGYQETGGGALNLKVASSQGNGFVLGLDEKISYRYDIPQHGSILFSAHAGVGYDFLSKQSEVSSSFEGGGNAFTTTGLKPDPLTWKGGVSASYNSDGPWYLEGSFETQSREGFNNQLFSLKASYSF